LLAALYVLCKGLCDPIPVGTLVVEALYTVYATLRSHICGEPGCLLLCTYSVRDFVTPYCGTLVDGCSVLCARDFVIPYIWGPRLLAGVYLLGKGLCDSISVGTLIAGCSVYCGRDFVTPFLSDLGCWFVFILCAGLCDPMVGSCSLYCVWDVATP